MLEIVLCDDDSSVISYYSTLLDTLSRNHGVAMRLRCFSSATACLFELDNAAGEVDMFFLDVQMPSMTGLALAKQLRELGSHAQIVFLSNEPGFVFDSFDVQPLYYLVKSRVDDAKFEDVFLRAVALAQKSRSQMVLFERGAERRTVALPDITFFEITKRVVTVHYSRDQLFSFYAKLETLADRFGDRGFIRVHRAFLVNAAYIRRLGAENIELADGRVLPLGRTYARQVRELLSSFLASGEMG